MRRKKSFAPVAPPKSCGKNRYNSKTEAEAVAREQEIIFAADELKLKTYRCASCGGWHLTRSAERYI